MTKDEYLAHADRQDDWAPGSSRSTRRSTPSIPESRLLTWERNCTRGRPLAAGVIDGYSIYPSPHGYQHLLTYGMSTLYVDEESFGGEFSGWGYEMTMKVRAESPDECRWAVSSLSNLGRYTYTSKRFSEPYQFVSGKGQPLRTGSDTLLTSYVVVPDTEVDGIDTVHGRVDFLQLVGITQPELDWVAGTDGDGAADRARELVARMAANGDDHLVTDLARTESLV